jgi:hypothetical protein
MGTGPFPGVKRPGRGVDHPPSSSAEAKERVELYIYSPSGPLWAVLGWTSNLPLHKPLRFKGVIFEHIIPGLKCSQNRDAYIFQIPRRYLKILHARRLTWSQSHIEAPQTLGTTLNNSVARPIWRPGFVYPCFKTFMKQQNEQKQAARDGQWMGGELGVKDKHIIPRCRPPDH